MSAAHGADGPSETVSIEFELTPEDWAEASLAHAKKSPLVREAMRRFQVAFVLIIACLALLGLLEGSTSLAVTFLLAGAVAMALIGPALRSGRRRQTLKYAREGIANGTFGHHRVELRPEGMLNRTEGYEWLTYWSSIERVEEGKGSFAVYTGPNAVVIIPHTAFPDSASLRQFSETFFALREADERKRIEEG
jgi:hypothetical protein